MKPVKHPALEQIACLQKPTSEDSQNRCKLKHWKETGPSLHYCMSCHRRGGNVHQFFSHENQPAPPFLFLGGKIRLGTHESIPPEMHDDLWRCLWSIPHSLMVQQWSSYWILAQQRPFKIVPDINLFPMQNPSLRKRAVMMFLGCLQTK